MNDNKKKRGRPKGIPTYTHSIRVNGLVKDFLKGQKNPNKLISDLIVETPEFQRFMKNLTEKMILDSGRPLF